MKEQHYKNPTPTVDAIIQKNSQILLVKRKKEPFKGYLVLPGGFVNEGERVEDAVKREIKEETSLDIVFIGKIPESSDKADAMAQDDAAAIEWLNFEAVDNTRIGFDHKKIITDFINWRQHGGTFWSSKK
jgi:8-oxo-dGTP diphosphatase